MNTRSARLRRSLDLVSEDETEGGFLKSGVMGLT